MLHCMLLQTTEFTTAGSRVDQTGEYARLLGGDQEGDKGEEVEQVGPVTTKHLLSWAHQVARGMEYLAQLKVITF